MTTPTSPKRARKVKARKCGLHKSIMREAAICSRMKPKEPLTLSAHLAGLEGLREAEELQTVYDGAAQFTQRADDAGRLARRVRESAPTIITALRTPAASGGG